MNEARKGGTKEGGTEGRTLRARARTEEGIRKERDEISRYNGVLARALRRSDKLTLGCAKELPQKESVVYLDNESGVGISPSGTILDLGITSVQGKGVGWSGKEERRGIEAR